MKRNVYSSKRDPVISLINIVFLILIFFMVAGNLSTPASNGISFVTNTDLDCCVPANALVVNKSGGLSFEGSTITTLPEFIAQDSVRAEKIALLPDKDLPAQELIAIIATLRENGVENIVVLSEKI